MEPSPLTREARAASWRVFALVLFSASYFYQSSGHNEAARFDQLRSVAEHGEWWIDRFGWNTLDRVRVGGHFYSNKAPGTLFLGVLPWDIARAVMAFLPISEDQQLVLVTYVLTILMSALPTALICLLMLRLLSRSGWSVPQATLLSAGYGLGTIAFPWATTFFGHQLSAAFAFMPFYLIWSCRWLFGASRNSRLALAGLMTGFLPVLEYPGAIASAVIVLYSIATLGLKNSRIVILGSLLGALTLPLYNEIAFGNPETISYSFLASGKSSVRGHRLGFMGASWPSLRGLSYITFESQRGLFHANPWLAFVLVAPFFSARVRGLRREFTLCAAILAGFLLFNSGFGGGPGYWGGGYSFGPRYSLIAVPFAVMLVAFVMKSRLLGPLVAVLIGGTMLLMLPAAAIDPRLPYEPREPFFGFYLPLYARGLYSAYTWATFKETVIFDSPGAFNLGRAAGLPHDLEILPLALLWAFAALTLVKNTEEGRARRVARTAAAISAIAMGAWPAFPRIESPRQPGMCEATSINRNWFGFPDFALLNEPSATPRYRRVVGPVIGAAGEQEEEARSATRVAVTFRSQLLAAEPGWHTIEVTAEGRVALYLDGFKRLGLDSPEQTLDRKATRVYLSRAPHELIVRYMSDKPTRQLYVTLARGDGPPSPLQSGLFSRACP